MYQCIMSARVLRFLANILVYLTFVFCVHGQISLLLGTPVHEFFDVAYVFSRLVFGLFS